MKNSALSHFQNAEFAVPCVSYPICYPTALYLLFFIGFLHYGRTSTWKRAFIRMPITYLSRTRHRASAKSLMLSKSTLILLCLNIFNLLLILRNMTQEWFSFICFNFYILLLYYKISVKLYHLFIRNKSMLFTAII